MGNSLVDINIQVELRKDCIYIQFLEIMFPEDLICLNSPANLPKNHDLISKMEPEKMT